MTKRGDELASRVRRFFRRKLGGKLNTNNNAAFDFLLPRSPAEKDGSRLGKIGG